MEEGRVVKGEVGIEGEEERKKVEENDTYMRKGTRIDSQLCSR